MIFVIGYLAVGLLLTGAFLTAHYDKMDLEGVGFIRFFFAILTVTLIIPVVFIFED